MPKAQRYKKYEDSKQSQNAQYLTEEDIAEHDRIANDLLSRPFSREDNPYGLSEVSEFVVKFPEFREPYIKEANQLISHVLKEKTLKFEIDFSQGQMTVSTIPKLTFDPFVIIKGRDFLKLISRGVSVEQAIRIFEDDVFYEFVPIRKYVKDQDAFIKRRKRLLGPDGNTLKALEILTKTYIVVMGKTCAVIGPVNGVKRICDIIVDTMKNIHPLHHIKRLMVEREIQNDPNYKPGEDYSRYLPEYKPQKKNIKRHKIEKKKTDHLKNVFPQAPQKSKIDLAIESGEYFMSKDDLEKNKKKKYIEAHKHSKEKRRERFEKLTTPIPEEKKLKKKEKKRDISNIIENINENTKQSKKRKRNDSLPKTNKKSRHSNM